MKPTALAKISAVLSLLALTACVTDSETGHSLPTDRGAVIPIDAQADVGDGLKKWVRPVRVSLVGEVSPLHTAIVDNRVQWLRTMTGHNVGRDDGAGGNVVLIVERDLPETALSKHAAVLMPLYSDTSAMQADLRDDGNDELCIAKRATSQAKPFEFAYAAGLVPADLSAEEAMACIHRLLVSSMTWSATKGQPLVESDDPEPDPTKKKIARGLTNLLEVVFLQSTYDRRAKPGMTVEEMKPIQDRVMSKVLKRLK